MCRNILKSQRGAKKGLTFNHCQLLIFFSLDCSKVNVISLCALQGMIVITHRGYSDMNAKFFSWVVNTTSGLAEAESARTLAGNQCNFGISCSTSKLA